MSKPRRCRHSDLIVPFDAVSFRFPIASKSFQLTNFLYLLRSICLSLDFNESSQGPFKQKEHSSASLERMRAFMGSFYLLTQVFTISKKGEAAL